MYATSQDGLRVAFEVAGAGEPTVLLHGLTDTRCSWRDAGYVEPLLRAGRQVILVDCRGHGDSGKPHQVGDYSGSNRVNDVMAVLDEVGVSSAHLMGFSMGGMIAMAVSIRQPGRVRSLTAIAAHPFEQNMAPFRKMFQDDIHPWLSMVKGLWPGLSQQAQRRVAANDIRALQACVAKDRPDISDALRRANVPTVLACGTLDPFYAGAERYAELSGCAFVPLIDRNHLTAFLAGGEIVAASLAALSQQQEAAFA